MKGRCWCMKRERMNWFLHPTWYLIDYRNNERQSRRHEEPIAVHSLHSRSVLLIRLLFFSCYRLASWMNARWTFESKPSWLRSYWSCRYWHHWYTRSVSEALLQCSLRWKMQWRRDKKRSAASWNTNLSLSATLFESCTSGWLESIINWHVKQITVINERPRSRSSDDLSTEIERCSKLQCIHLAFISQVVEM